MSNEKSGRTGKFCVAAGGTSTHKDNLSLHEFPKENVRPNIRRSQGLVTIQVNILSMYKHIQGRTSFFTPARFKSCLFFKFLLIYSKPCLVQLPRPYSFKKYHYLPSTTSCEGAAVVFVRNSPE